MLSVYVSFLKDFDYLERVIQSVINFAEEVHFVDGPNFPTLPGFCSSGISVDIESCKYEFNNFLEQCDFMPSEKKKLKYHWGIWKNEREKRKFGFNCCSQPLVMTLDADEIIDFTESFLDMFAASNTKVAGVECLNMYKSDVFLGGDFYNYRHNVSKKNILFKREIINADRHLDFLWLVNHEPETPINQTDIYNGQSLGTMYHATSMRSEEGKLVKNIFYQSFGKEKASIEEIADWSSNLSRKSNDKTLMQHGSFGLIGFPMGRKFFKDPYPEKRNQEILSYISKVFTNNLNKEIDNFSAKELISGEYWFRCYLAEDKTSASIELHTKCTIKNINVFIVTESKTPQKIPDDKVKVEVDNSKVTLKIDCKNEHIIIEPVVQMTLVI